MRRSVDLPMHRQQTLIQRLRLFIVPRIKVDIRKPAQSSSQVGPRFTGPCPYRKRFVSYLNGGGIRSSLFQHFAQRIERVSQTPFNAPTQRDALPRQPLRLVELRLIRP